MKEKLEEYKKLLLIYQANIELDKKITKQFESITEGKQKVKTLYKH